ncbi:L-rhamnose-binding lectin CSL2-like [Denticeps clupeoides]|uniref:L-rhamnose-binding lectin CSL2-like n=1 Tax=Denticeps clupeoides TaxID=299321 RepID=UPI0010A4B55F|nr:L-rhamnose-binding lectin CSL2-like [Denticeps clupeoides]
MVHPCGLLLFVEVSLCRNQCQLWDINCMSMVGQNVIKVLSSNFGRGDRTTCSEGQLPDQLNNTNCFLPGTLKEMSHSCDGKNRCSVSVSTWSVAPVDPCNDTTKYLDVSYTCLPAVRSIICEHSITTLNCDNGVLKIYSANYGRKNRTTCSVGYLSTELSDVNCGSSRTMQEVTKRCQGKTTCDLSANNDIFGDPCIGTYKYLDLSYACLPTRRSY